MTKPCPFCTDAGEVRFQEPMWFVKCCGCDARGPLEYNRDEAISSWEARRAMKIDKNEQAFDALEDALVAGLHADSEGRVSIDGVMPLLEAARAVLMIHRGVEPLMPKRSAA